MKYLIIAAISICSLAFSTDFGTIKIPESVGYMQGDTVVLNYGKFRHVKIGDNVYKVTSPELKKEDVSFSPLFESMPYFKGLTVDTLKYSQPFIISH